VASKAVALSMPSVGSAQKAFQKALGEFAQLETAALVGGILTVPLAEKAAYSSFRQVFGNSGTGLTDKERLARHLFRFGLALLGGYLAATGKREVKAFGTGLMAEATVNLLKGFGLTIA